MEGKMGFDEMVNNPGQSEPLFRSKLSQ